MYSKLKAPNYYPPVSIENLALAWVIPPQQRQRLEVVIFFQATRETSLSWFLVYRSHCTSCYLKYSVLSSFYSNRETIVSMM